MLQTEKISPRDKNRAKWQPYESSLSNNKAKITADETLGVQGERDNKKEKGKREGKKSILSLRARRKGNSFYFHIFLDPYLIAKHLSLPPSTFCYLSLSLGPQREKVN
ncbi:hypothetical protein CDAR_236291 [Caerostris darwini]|uniref:Uncharacterized protein n=1 Tax=Caerostris darwini TaxID=1538125 RepID=A0AAV4TE58_9ARAC|nr:hypothetical protein CDAR_236291 [Caerostris darwini]